MEDINLVTVGHVDHGKSSIIGRLLVDTNSLPDGKVENIKRMCEKQSKVFEYAYLLDALKDEQSQSITIDSARCFFKTKNRKVLLRDAPGHLEFLKNMITGASTADAALLVIDVVEGMRENSKRHSYLLSILKIKQIVVLINKMDLVNFDKSRYDTVKEECQKYLDEIGVKVVTYIPVSAQTGDNISKISKSMEWYKGNTLLEIIDKLTVNKPNYQMDFRMPLQAIYKFSSDNDNRRIFAGSVLTGKAEVGDKIVFYPSGKSSIIKTIEEHNVFNKNKIMAGEAVGFTLKDEIYVKRGEVACIATQNKPIVSENIVAKIFWLGAEPLKFGKRYYLKCGHSKVETRLVEINKLFDAENLISKSDKKYVEQNHIAECILALKEPIAFDVDIFENSRFVIVDDYEISGGGVIINTSENANRYENIKNIDYSTRCKLLKQKGQVIWLTGRSGAGKTTIAVELEKRLTSMGKLVYRLDGDCLREGLNKDLGFSTKDRTENIRRFSEVAKLFADAGIITIVSTISPLASIRNITREILSNTQYCEIYVKTSYEECKKRDPKGLYKNAFNGSQVIDYEEDNQVNVLETEKVTLNDEIDKILNLIEVEA